MAGFFDSLLSDPSFQGEAVAVAFDAMFGSKPSVVKYANGEVELRLTEAQRQQVVDFLNRQLAYHPPKVGEPARPKKPGLNISFMPILLPVVVRNFWYVPAIPFISGFFTGRRWGRKKRVE